MDKLKPSLRNVAIKGVKPNVNSCHVTPSAVVAGNVTIGSKTALWYGATVRGHQNSVTIGENSSIGDLSFVTSQSSNTKIGSNVSVGSGVCITDSILEDNSIVGDGAKLFKGVRVESHAMVAAGAVVSPGTVIPKGQVWAGSPATYLRDLTSTELSALQTSHAETLELAVVHAIANAKTWEQIERDEYDLDQKEDRNSEYYQQLSPEEMSKIHGEVEGHMVPGRILDSPVSARNTSSS